ncbi:hypothetical protein PYW07_013506 [Mythimna separata]|uniref:Uncharacterized protein n=1 Tax=Mythimna separata TaxID=271217 RepID=A0AAD7YAD2_MYTSE|nr:hypothetical protein PYW07_013506 [Mythimna separata]
MRDTKYVAAADSPALLGNLATKRLSSSKVEIFSRAPSGDRTTITPSCVQHDVIPKCSLALLKTVCLVRVRNSLTATAEPFSLDFVLHIADLLSTLENLTRIGLLRVVPLLAAPSL